MREWRWKRGAKERIGERSERKRRKEVGGRKKRGGRRKGSRSNIEKKGGRGYTVPKEIDFPQYNMKWSGENLTLRGIFHVVSGLEIWMAFLTV